LEGVKNANKLERDFLAQIKEKEKESKKKEGNGKRGRKKF
jgi:hypothetical protein